MAYAVPNEWAHGDYPTAAQRPSYSLLDCSTSREALGLQPLHWRAALAQVLRQCAA